MTEEIKYILLGLIQGLAEFFPISSSGHIILISSILDVAQENPLLLSITVHFATTLSTIIVYRERLKNMFLGIVRHESKNEISFFFKLLVSSFPIVIIGLFFRENIELVFNEFKYLVSIMLVVTGVLLIMTKYFNKEKKKITYYHALLMGLAQAVAIIPGISRSGATISTALMCKIKGKDAAEFSFLMVLLPIIGITLFEVIMVYSSNLILDSKQIQGLIIAFFTALLSGLFACKYMILIVTNNTLQYFGYYCITIGLLFYFLFF